METPTSIQVINGPDGQPAFVVIPYAEYMASREKDTVPHAVVEQMVLNGLTLVRAWREHLGLTQQEMANRLEISQSAYAQQESSPSIRNSTRRKIALALGIAPNLLSRDLEVNAPIFVVDFTPRTIDAILSSAAAEGRELVIDVCNENDPSVKAVAAGRLSADGVFKVTLEDGADFDWTFEFLKEKARLERRGA
jgi:transcriptional regulator with XRE-family HTH domain